MQKEKKINKRKAGVRFGTIVGIILVCFILLMNVQIKQDDGEWQVVFELSSAEAAEANPGTGASGWLAGFHICYGVTPATVLASNASGGGYDSWDNVTGYVSADDTATDLPSENLSYIVMRARFNKTHCWDDTKFIDARCRMYLTVSGDETISNVLGTRVVSANNTNYGYIFINFYWDDGADGYRVTDDGTLTWNITAMAQF